MTSQIAYTADSIKVLEEVRRHFNVVGLSKRIRRKGDVLLLSNELKIKPKILQFAINEGRIKNLLPNIQKSKASILVALRTDRDIYLFSKKHDFNKISARELIKLIRQWNKNLQKNPSLLLTPKEHDLIVGSLMGGANIRKREKNSCFRVSHSIKQKKYIKHKLKILNQFNFSEFEEVERIIKKRKVTMVNLSTKTHVVFNYYRNLFYDESGNKKVNLNILAHLNSRSLAFWICDGGGYNNKQGYIILCTNSFSLEEHILMKDFFNKTFGLNPAIGFRDRKYYYLRFKQQDSKKLIGIIKPFIPDCMLYKIGGIKHDCE